MSGAGKLVSPGTDMLMRGLAFAVGALLTMNYYGMGGATGYTSLANLVPALVIGVIGLLIEVYLPRAEYYVESQL
jgi:hypothetical protein